MSDTQRWLSRATAALVPAFLALSAPLAHAVVIGFESPELTGVWFTGDSFTEAGYSFTTRADFGTVDTAASLGFQAPIGDATQFYFAGNQGSLGIASTSGALFSLSSFSAAFVPLDVPSAQTTVLVAVGNTATNTSVTAYWSFGASNSSQFPFVTYASAADFTAFGSLKSVEFHACSIVGTTLCSLPLSNNGQFAIDNITLSAVPAVPEPATMAMAFTGLLGIAAMVRRRRAG